MRIDTAAFSASNQNPYKEPRFYIEVMFDDAYTDPYYFTSHDDVDLPATATSVNTFYSSIIRIKNSSQKLNIIKALSTIGGGECEILDKDGTLSDLLQTKWIGGEALREKRFRTYVGYKGLLNADYVLVSTNLKQGHIYNGTSYIFTLEDLQRNVKKDIFVLETTTLTYSVLIDQVAIPVTSTNSFLTNWHDANYSDLPSTDVGYISIKQQNNKEVISWLNKVTTSIGKTGTDISFAIGDSSINATSTDLSVFSAGQYLEVSGSTSNDGNYIVNTVTSTKLTLYDLDGITAATIVTEAAGATITLTAPIQFYNCTRGALNTYAKAYEVDTTISTDRREKVTEHVYLDTWNPKIIYALLTGVWFGTANVCPWNLGIDTSLVNSSSFTQYLDLFDSTNDAGMRFRFSGEKKIDGKKFIQEQLCRPLALYLRVLNDGDLALRRATSVLSESAYVKHLTEADILKVGSIKYEDSEVYNIYTIDWNWEDSKEETTRQNILIDNSSLTKQKLGKEVLGVEWRGLHGSASTLQNIYSNFNMLRDRYAGPPIKWTIQVLHKHNDLEIGDVIRVTLLNVRDATNKVVTNIDRSFEIQGKTVDWITGNVTLELFGSTEKSSELSSTTAPTVMSNTFYTTGSALSSSVTIVADHMTVNGSLTGNEDGSLATYYHGADLTINSGITLTIDKNVRLLVKGHLTLDGTITSKGNGDTNADGVMGITKSSGALTVRDGAFGGITVTVSPGGSTNQGTYESLPYYDIQPDSVGDSLSGVPIDLQGMVGPNGGNSNLAFTQSSQTHSITGSQTGGNGGNGGGGLVIVCRGISAGASGKIITSGADGSDGGAAIYTKNNYYSYTFYAGSGGGGAPGGCLILIDGNDYTSTLSNSNFEQYLGDSKKIGSPWYTYESLWTKSSSGSFRNGNYVSYDTQNQNDSYWRVQYIPDTTTPVADASDYATIPTISTPTETQNSPQTTGQNLSTVQIDLTPPIDSNYAYSNVYYKEASQTDYVYVGPARNSVTLPPTIMDGSTYDVIAKPVSVAGIESESYTHTTATVSSAYGGVTFGSGNYLQNTSNPSSTGGFKIDASYMRAWNTSGSQTYNLDFSNGSFTFGIVADDQFVKYDASTGVVSLGRDTQLLGSDAYNNDTIYLSGLHGNFYLTDGSTGSGSLGNFGQVIHTVTATSDLAKSRIIYAHPLTLYTWANARRFKMAVQVDNTSSLRFTIGSGAIASGTMVGMFAGFRFDNDGNIYGVSGNGANEESTSLQTYAANTDYIVEFEYTPNTDVKFYIDGTYTGTAHSTYIPDYTTTTAANQVVHGYLVSTSAGTYTATTGEFKLEQQ